MERSVMLPMQERNGYLSEEELQQLIAETEEQMPYRAPDYLEQMILQKAKPVTASKNRQLFSYSLKIVAAAAAALALIFTIPVTQENDYEAYRRQIAEEQQKRKEEWEKTRGEKSTMQNVNDRTNEICRLLSDKTSELLFQKEDK